MLGQIGSALHAAHQLGIIHRDVKPENLFLQRRADGVIVAKVLDFGISKFSADAGIGLTTTGAFVGTPLYMAPEQAHSDNDKITPATDIWALGLVTLRLLTGEHLWGSPSMAELVTKIVVSPIPKPSERWPDSAVMSPELDAWFARSCDRDPTKRWSSVDDQMRSLKDALDVVPIALADTRPSGSLAVNTTTTSERSPARSRRPLQALGIGVLVFAAVAIWLRVCGGPSELSGPVVAAWEAAAVEDSSILLLNDLPASFTTSDSARTKFRVRCGPTAARGRCIGRSNCSMRQSKNTLHLRRHSWSARTSPAHVPSDSTRRAERLSAQQRSNATPCPHATENSWMHSHHRSWTRPDTETPQIALRHSLLLIGATFKRERLSASQQSTSEMPREQSAPFALRLVFSRVRRLRQSCSRNC